ncbi:hypothetical protein CC78DRAFT_141194 [Lojkania enalia]|uniref:Uncharacterized protein n=1 Tax=Lojkania enalia TaxID=147567 RepID=A0A9P4NCJ5_9PLEO|nr:hypothetical protein CC78DRAFT_141194 [Didymosphaeria enalia]
MVGLLSPLLVAHLQFMDTLGPFSFTTLQSSFVLSGELQLSSAKSASSVSERPNAGFQHVAKKSISFGYIILRCVNRQTLRLHNETCLERLFSLLFFLFLFLFLFLSF